MLWANRGVMEQLGLLKILFYIFYEQPYDANSICELITLFNSNSFGLKQSNINILSDECREIVNSMKYICNLIIIEALQLENLMEPELVSFKYYLFLFIEIFFNILIFYKVLLGIIFY